MAQMQVIDFMTPLIGLEASASERSHQLNYQLIAQIPALDPRDYCVSTIHKHYVCPENPKIAGILRNSNFYVVHPLLIAAPKRLPGAAVSADTSMTSPIIFAG